MQLTALFLLTLCHFLSGYGILSLLAIRKKPIITFTLSLILGVAVASFLPFVLQLCYIPITPTSVFGSLAIGCLLLNAKNLWDLARGKKRLPSFQQLWTAIRSIRIRIYEVPYILILGFFIIISVWRCYYLPPTSRDALSGPEAIAEYAVREHTMINSFFKVDLASTNNQFKSPFLISLQIIYKMAGFPFGQVWLSLLFVSFTILLYHILKERIHPVIAGALSLILMMAPELYAYTFMILYDYSNMVYLFLGLYFLIEYFKQKVPTYFYLSGLLIGIATYVRSETLLLAALFIPLILWAQFREKYTYAKMAWMTGLFILPTLLGYYLPTQLYIKHYLPVKYDIGSLVNDNLSDLHPLFTRYQEIISKLLVGDLATRLWGYITYIFFVFLLAEAVLLRKFSKEARNWLYAIAVIYIGIGFLGWLLPLMNLMETTKRAMFKLLPLMLLYLVSNGWMVRLSTWITRWEQTSAPMMAGGGSAGKGAVLSKGAPAGKRAAGSEDAGKAAAARGNVATGKTVTVGNTGAGNAGTGNADSGASAGKGKKKRKK